MRREVEVCTRCLQRRSLAIFFPFLFRSHILSPDRYYFRNVLGEALENRREKQEKYENGTAHDRGFAFSHAGICRVGSAQGWIGLVYGLLYYSFSHSLTWPTLKRNEQQTRQHATPPLWSLLTNNLSTRESYVGILQREWAGSWFGRAYHVRRRQTVWLRSKSDFDGTGARQKRPGSHPGLWTAGRRWMVHGWICTYVWCNWANGMDRALGWHTEFSLLSIFLIS